MTTFYVLPSRDELGERLRAMVGPLLPGIGVDAESCRAAMERLLWGAAQRREGIAVFRDDLSEPDATGRELAARVVKDCGAEPGDRILTVEADKIRGTGRAAA